MGAPPDPPDSAHRGHAGATPIPPHDHGPVDRSSVRSSQIIRWCVHLSVTISLAVPAGLVLASTLSRRGTLDAFTLVPVVVGGFAVVVLGWLIVVLPRHWTAQGVDVRPCCLGIVAGPMWWFRGRQAFVAWEDVHAIARGTRTAGRRPAVSGPAAVLDRLSSLGHEVTLQVHLHRVDPRLSLPSWVTLILPGEATPGTGSLPRLVLTVADAPRASLERTLRAARGDLFDLDRSARRATARPPGTAQGRSGAESVSLRGAGFVPLWLGRAGLAVVIMGALAAACLVYAVVDGIVHGFEADEFPVLVVLATFAVPVTGWSVYSLPRLVTDQGVSADDSGVTLAQQPRWWFRGTLVRIPWTDVRTISEDVLVTGDAKNRTSHLVVELRLRRPQPGVMPTWVEVKRRRQSPTALVIMPGGRRRHRRVVAALRAVRPDYFPA